MKKWFFLISIFLFGCKKKEDGIPLVNVNQYPSSIFYYDVDLNSNAEYVRFQATYFYNDSNRIDSVLIVDSVSTNTYRFNYSQFVNNNKILLIKDNPTAPNDVLTYESTYYNLVSYYQILAANDTVKRLFEYDSINRFRSLENRYTLGLNYYITSQTYKRDTVFMHTEFPSSLCFSNDTLINSSVEMSKTLPYLLFTKLYNSCATIVGPEVSTILPLSSFTNKLPKKIISNNSQLDYTYSYDNSGRITEVVIAMKNRTSNALTSKRKLKINY